MEERKSKTFPPVYNRESKILILGTAPSIKSVEDAFFYGHPQNRFWKVLARLCNSEVPATIEQKKAMLLKNRIALWDVIDECDITGSADSSIKNVVPADIAGLLAKTNITKIFCNGKTAGNLYEKFCKEHTGMEAVVLPSTSPANAAFSLEKLVECWKRGLYDRENENQ